MSYVISWNRFILKTIKRYDKREERNSSVQFKLSIVEEIEKNGLSIANCRRKYGIGGSTTIQKWLKKYGKNHLLNKIVRVETIDEIRELQALKKELKALKEAFAETTLENKVYKTYFQILGQETGMGDEIKKS